MLTHFIAHEEHKLRVKRIEKHIRHNHSPEPRQRASRMQLLLETLGR
jgi:hypothetical protein